MINLFFKGETKMEVIRDGSIKNEIEDVVVALGTFDGVHYGHQQIINETITDAKKSNCKSALFTFAPHPLSILSSKAAPGLITNWEQKSRILSDLGLDKIYLKEFNSDFAKLNFRTFVEDYLVKGVNAKKVVVGQDFRFGYKGLGNVERLKELGLELGFKVKVLGQVTVEEEIVSSTYIRGLIATGQVEKVKTYLTRNYSLIGKVINGDQRGRELGFPTANLKPVTDYITPASGVYAVYVHIVGKKLAGVAHLGPRPTFDNDDFTIEVHILNFNDDLYQREIEVEFIERIRGELNFNDQQGLIKQIKDDIATAKQILI